jgi:hypothetical protein
MSLIGLLEDDLETRAPAMKEVLGELGLACAHFDDARGFNAWLDARWDEVALLSLDHDLGPTRPVDGRRFDPGVGMWVVDVLVARAPRFPVLVHSANPHEAPRMVFRLEEAGWAVTRVYPEADRGWIDRRWRSAVAGALGLTPRGRGLTERG